VLGDVDKRVAETLEDVSKLVEERGRGQARAVLDFLGRRPSMHSTTIVGTLHDSHFDGVRFRVLSKLEDEVNGILGHKNFDRDAVSRGVTDELRSRYMSPYILFKKMKRLLTPYPLHIVRFVSIV
jgi:hypothetical protein